MNNQHNTTLTVACDAGLCNRILVLITGYVAAEATGRKFKMLWPRTAACAASYYELFSNDLNVQVVENSSIKNYPRYDGVFKIAPDLLLEKSVDISLVSYHTLINPAYYGHHEKLLSRCFCIMNSLKPVPKILDKVRQFDQKYFSSKMIGVHLRRGDFVRYNPEGYRNTSNTLAQTEKYLKVFPDAGVFLCTDDNVEVGQKYSNNLPKNVREIFNAYFGNRVCYRIPKSIDRSSSHAIQDAMIDLWLLRKTDMIVGTDGSSFSKLSAWGRDVQVVYCKETNLANEIERFCWQYTGLARLMRELSFPEANKDVDIIKMREKFKKNVVLKIKKKFKKKLKRFFNESR